MRTSWYRGITVVVVVAIFLSSSAAVLGQGVDPDRIERDRQACRAAHTDAKGGLDVRAYLKCQDDKGRAHRDAETQAADAVAKKQQAEYASSPDRWKRDLAACQAESRGVDGRLDGINFSRCVAQRDRVRHADEEAVHAADLAENQRRTDAEAAAARQAAESLRAKQEAEDAAALAKFEADKAADEARYRASVERREAEQVALSKKCGKDFGAIRLGMSAKRLEDCSGPFSSSGAAAGPGGTTVHVIENAWWIVRVVGGRVQAWVAK